MRRSPATVNLFRRALSTFSGNGGGVHKPLTSYHPQALPAKRVLFPAVASPVGHSPAALWQRRSLCSSSGSENICLIKSEEQLDSAVKRIKEESEPALFYFTATWCGPCRVISPAVEELSKKYHYVKTYKIDIDEESIQDRLFEMKIAAVPTLQFFHSGKKVDEVVGADIARVKLNMEKFYQQ